MQKADCLWQSAFLTERSQTGFCLEAADFFMQIIRRCS